MSLSFALELDAHVRRDGTRLLMLRVTLNRKLKRVKLGLHIEEKFWNADKKEIRRSHPMFTQYNALIRAKITEFEKSYLSTAIKGDHPELPGKKKIEVANSFSAYMRQRIPRLPSPNTRKGQISVLEKFQEFNGGKDILFSDLTKDMISDYKYYLEKKLGNNSNTIHSNIAKLKAAYNEAVENEVYIPSGRSPFLGKIKKTKSKRNRLSEDAIELIESINSSTNINHFHALNIFLFAYYMQGARVGDVLRLTWDQVAGGRLAYTANKTKKSRSRVILSKADEILAYYKTQHYEGDYIFPWMAGKLRANFSEDDWFKELDRANSRIRKYLKEATHDLGIGSISMHVARHSFADIAIKKTGDLYKLMDSLDHSALSTTVNYLNDAEAAENDDFVRSVIGD